MLGAIFMDWFQLHISQELRALDSSETQVAHSGHEISTHGICNHGVTLVVIMGLEKA